MARHSTITGPWKVLIDAAGGVCELARLLEVPSNYIWRWGMDKCSPSITRDIRRIEAVCKRLEVANPLDAEVDGPRLGGLLANYPSQPIAKAGSGVRARVTPGSYSQVSRKKAANEG